MCNISKLETWVLGGRMQAVVLLLPKRNEQAVGENFQSALLWSTHLSSGRKTLWEGSPDLAFKFFLIWDFSLLRKLSFNVGPSDPVTEKDLRVLGCVSLRLVGQFWKYRSLCSPVFNSCFWSGRRRYLGQKFLSFIGILQVLCRKESNNHPLVMSCIDLGWWDRGTPGLRVFSWSWVLRHTSLSEFSLNVLCVNYWILQSCSCAQCMSPVAFCRLNNICRSLSASTNSQHSVLSPDLSFKMDRPLPFQPIKTSFSEG